MSESSKDANALSWARSETYTAIQYIKARPHYPLAIIDLIVAYHKQSASAEFTAAADLGCGPGQLALHLASVPFEKVYGIDPTPRFVELANSLQKMSKEEGAELGLPTPPPRPIEFIKGTASETTLPDQSVDLVTAGTTAHWWGMEDPEVKRRTWGEIARVLKPGGTMAILALYPMFGAAKNPDPRVVELQHFLVNVILDSPVARYWNSASKTAWIHGYAYLPIPDEDSSEWNTKESKLFFQFDFPEHLMERPEFKPYHRDTLPSWAPSALKEYDQLTTGSLAPTKSTPKDQANFFRSASGYIRYLDEHPEEKDLIASEGDWIAREIKRICEVNGIGYEEEIEGRPSVQVILFRRK